MISIPTWNGPFFYKTMILFRNGGGDGYATEVVKVIINYTFTELKLPRGILH
nr:GNAT family N-acetyltransferase [Bacillus mycoides]